MCARAADWHFREVFCYAAIDACRHDTEGGWVERVGRFVVGELGLLFVHFVSPLSPRPASLGGLTPPLDARGEPRAAFIERAILATRDHGKGQAFGFQAARGATRGAAEHKLAELGVGDENVTRNFDAIREFVGVFEGQGCLQM
jgi:hypothetical protein